MKTRGELQGAKLKPEPIRDEETHEITNYDVYWLVTVKIPAHKVNANELHRMVGQDLEFELTSNQLSLGLEPSSVSIHVEGSEPIELTPAIAQNADRALLRGRKARTGRAA